MNQVRILFMGTPDYALPSLRNLLEGGYEVVGVVTQPDRPKGRKQLLTPPPVKEFALAHRLPVYQPEKIRKAEALDQILSLKPDLIVTAAYGQILPKRLLDSPRYGAVNVHASLLPKYRGAAPIHYAIMHGEVKTGATLMMMTPELDAGDILAQEEVRIGRRDTAGDLFSVLAEMGGRLLLKTLPEYLAGRITPVPQDHTQATYAPTLKKEDERLDFSLSAKQLYNRIRGLNPWPVAYATLNGERIKIWWSETVAGEAGEAPGTILSAAPAGIDVATGEGILRLTEIQPAGKKRMTAEEYLRGNQSLAKGMKLA